MPEAECAADAGLDGGFKGGIKGGKTLLRWGACLDSSEVEAVNVN